MIPTQDQVLSYTNEVSHLGERQTEVHFSLAFCAVCEGTVFDPQKLHMVFDIFPLVFYVFSVAIILLLLA